MMHALPDKIRQLAANVFSPVCFSILCDFVLLNCGKLFDPCYISHNISIRESAQLLK